MTGRLVFRAISVLALIAIGARAMKRSSPRARDTAPTTMATISSIESLPPLLDSAFADSVEHLSEVQAILESRMRNTYLGELLAAHDSMNFRWPDRRNERLRVWVQDVNPTRPEFARRIVGDAFRDWTGSGIPVGFTIVLDSSRAEVRVTWVDRFDAMMTGLTRWTTNSRGWIVAADIQLARQQPDGTVLDDASLAAIARHEAGHLLGLDHTLDPTSVMAARVRVSELSEADRRTVRLVYDLPPGRLPVP